MININDKDKEKDIRGEAAGVPADLHTDEPVEETELPDEVDDVDENIFGSMAEGNEEE